MSDTVLIGIAALLNLVLTFLGLFVAIRPVEQEKSKKRILFCCFAACVLALGLAVWVAKRGAAAQTTLQSTAEHILGAVTSVQTSVDSIPAGSSAPAATQATPHYTKPTLPNGFLQFKKIQYVTGDELFTVGKPLQLNVYYINKGPVPVQNADITASLVLAGRNSRAQKAIDADALRSFQSALRSSSNQEDKGSPLGSDNLLWTSPSLPVELTQQMVNGIMRNQALLYVISKARWTDSYGKSNEVIDCVWLNAPYSEHPELERLVWQECER